MRAILLGLIFSVAWLPAQAEPCDTWRSLDGQGAIEFQDESWGGAFTQFVNGHILQCSSVGGGTGISVRGAYCEGDLIGDQPLFFVPTDPDDPEAGSILIFGVEPFYSTCN